MTIAFGLNIQSDHGSSLIDASAPSNGCWNPGEVIANSLEIDAERVDLPASKRGLLASSVV